MARADGGQPRNWLSYTNKNILGEITMEISGSKAIFVGGASGMCRATAIKFAEKGGQVAILDMEQSNGAEVAKELGGSFHVCNVCLLYTSPSPRDATLSRMPSSA